MKYLLHIVFKNGEHEGRLYTCSEDISEQDIQTYEKQINGTIVNFTKVVG